MNQVVKAILLEFSNHVENCRKENPNMTAGECISKISFLNVTQLSALLQGFLLMAGGNK